MDVRTNENSKTIGYKYLVGHLVEYIKNADQIDSQEVFVTIVNDTIVMYSNDSHCIYAIVQESDRIVIHTKLALSNFDPVTNQFMYDALNDIPLFYSIDLRRSSNIKDIANKMWLNAYPLY